MVYMIVSDEARLMYKRRTDKVPLQDVSVLFVYRSNLLTLCQHDQIQQVWDSSDPAVYTSQLQKALDEIWK